MVARATVELFAKPIYKLITRGVGQKGRRAKSISHYEYGGKKYQLDDMKKVMRRGEKGMPLRGYVPKEVEAERIAKSDLFTPVLPKTKRRATNPSKIKKLKALDAMSDEKLRYLTKTEAERLGLGENILAPYRQSRLGEGTYGIQTKFVDAEGKPIYVSGERNKEAIDAISEKNTRIVYDTLNAIDVAGDRSFQAPGALM